MRTWLRPFNLGALMTPVRFGARPPELKGHVYRLWLPRALLVSEERRKHPESQPALPAVPEGLELFSTSGDPKEQPHILGTSALVEDSAVPRRALLKEAHHQEKAKGCSLL
ncbi:unnamed protein product [Lepidochelys kempii]